ncbi:MAG: NAD(P)H-hydrate dehydratase [Verrucomicrobiota bacterium]
MPVPIISVEQMREWERATWLNGQTEKKVIARVGKLVAERALAMTQLGEKILILAGKGHNGDDARAALSHLTGRKVVLMEVREPKKSGVKFSEASADAMLIVDGLFGIGLNRPLAADWQKLIQSVNDSRIPVLAIDAPSGVDADSGEILGEAVRAAITLTLAAPKRGFFRASAIPFVGRLEVASEIGLVPSPFRGELNWTLPKDFLNFPPTRPVTGHKGTFGHAAIVGGSLGYHGAAVLATRAALRAQPGLASVFTPENVYLPVAAQLQAAMVHPWKNPAQLPETTSAILFGPGLAAKNLPNNLKREFISLWKTSALPMVADAGALRWLPVEKKSRNANRVITPHPGEAAELLSMTTEKIQADRVSALRNLSARYGNCVVVLKGHQTLVGRADGKVFINGSGNPFLAQGGSGDVLAGYITGLVAQPLLRDDFMKTICYAVWQHGAAADFLSATQNNWTIENLLETLGQK